MYLGLGRLLADDLFFSAPSFGCQDGLSGLSIAKRVLFDVMRVASSFTRRGQAKERSEGGDANLAGRFSFHIQLCCSSFITGLQDQAWALARCLLLLRVGLLISVRHDEDKEWL